MFAAITPEQRRKDEYAIGSGLPVTSRQGGTDLPMLANRAHSRHCQVNRTKVRFSRRQ